LEGTARRSRRASPAHGDRQDGDDLEQVAAIGLLEAIDRFDPDRGVSFSTIALPTILGELKRYLRDNGWSVRVPRAIQELALRVERMSADLAASRRRRSNPARTDAGGRCHGASRRPSGRW